MSSQKKSIRLKLLFHIIVASSCITFLFILLLLWVDLKSNIKVADAQVNQMEKTIIPALKGSLWKFDESQIRISLESFLSLPSVVHVELNWNEAQSGDHTIEMGNKPTITGGIGDIRQHNLLYKATNTQEYHLGELTITTSEESAYSNLYKSAIYIVLLQTVKTLFISFIILFIFQKVLTRHILDIARQSKKLTLSNLDTTFLLNRKNSHGNYEDELDEVVNALNQMRVQIKNDIEQKQQTTAALSAEIENSREKEKQAFAAQKSDEAKSLFLASISHEIRTPMNAILGFAHLLKKADLKDDDKRYIDYIDRSAQSLLMLINNVLDMSKLEADKTDVEHIPFYLDNVIEMVNATFEEQAKIKELAFDFVIDDSIPQQVYGDQNRLLQILNNLISNAIKFTDEGKVKVNISCINTSVASKVEIINGVEKTKDTETLIMQFTVNDSGIGISPEYLPRLFDVFSQDDASTTRRYGGTGLGMPIVHKLVTLLGGDIHVESIVGVGTVAKFTLPFTVCSDHHNDTKRIPINSEVINKPLDGRILVVDDAEINQALMVSMLESMGAEVVIAGNGKIAVEQVIKNEFDLILMDIQMPIMNGFEAAKAIRQHNSDVSKLPIIALTANVMEGFKEKCFEAGMDDYLCKPFDPDILYEKIQSYLIPSGTLPKTELLEKLTIEIDDTDEKSQAINKLRGNHFKGINIDLGIKRWPNDPSEYFVHVLAFIDEVDVSGVMVNKLYAEGKFKELSTFIHRISGSASFLALDNLSRAAASIEKALYQPLPSNELTKHLSRNQTENSIKVSVSLFENYHNAVAEISGNKTNIEKVRDLANY